MDIVEAVELGSDIGADMDAHKDSGRRVGVRIVEDIAGLDEPSIHSPDAQDSIHSLYDG